MINVLSGKCNESIPDPVKTYPFELDHFQKHSHLCISKKENVLVTAHTGSGKTVVADYAIAQCLRDNRRVIYTSPIKTLSNQKYKEFSEVYPSVGIMTGDIKMNIDAQCVIMTTEILRNLLYKDEKHIEDEFKDFIKDVDCVIFDEVHYINDISRGEVWETCLILMPKRIYMVMLSATIDRAEEFASWIANTKGKVVNLISNERRVIPLKHHVYSKGEMKMVMDENNKFGSVEYDDVRKSIVPHGSHSRDSTNPSKVLNPFIEFLKERNLTPALFFVFSRKKCQRYAEMIQTSMLTQEDISLVNRTYDKYIHPFKEKYSDSCQFEDMRKLLHKGVAIHHSGMLPILKEVIEILFGMGLIKLLFATETFAVGVNMPTKTVIFTDLSKFDGYKNDMRILYPEEYKQMAGRAGRRGMDLLGIVIYLPLGSPPLSRGEAYSMMTGKVASISSKFQIGYQFVLRVMQSEDLDMSGFVDLTLYNKENDVKASNMDEQAQKKRSDFEKARRMMRISDIGTLGQVVSLESSLVSGVRNSQFKKTMNQIKKLKNDYPGSFDEDMKEYKYIDGMWKDLSSLEESASYMKKIKTQNMEKVLSFLYEMGYIIFKRF